MEIAKVSNNEIKVVKTETVVTENIYSVELLTKRRQDILDRQAENNALRDAEIAEIDAILAECVKLDVAAEPESI